MKHFIIRHIANYLRRDRERAEAIIEATFPGFVLRKRRKDAGSKKMRKVDLDKIRDLLNKKKEGGENG